jgi:type I restriction enzyme M protein
MTGTGGLQRVPPSFIKATLIPLPPMKVQREIVAQIEKEQEIVNANKQFIEIFEQKIKDRIAKVWGAEKKEPLLYEENELLSLVAEPQN